MRMEKAKRNCDGSMGDKSAAETSEDFAAHLNNIVHGGFITMAIGMGVDTGLFEVMCGMDGPKTSQDIADLAGLKERYVREWLGAMVTARIVDIDGDLYHIPIHRIDSLKPRSQTSIMTRYATGVPVLSSVYTRLMECFKKDGPRGIDYAHYADYGGFVASMSSEWFENHLIEDFVSDIPGLEDKLEAGIQVLDLGCGKGGAALQFARHYPNSQVYGLDFSKECIAHAQKSAADRGLKNLHFVCQDAADLDLEWNEKFDYVFVHAALHDQAYPDKVLGEIHRAMKPDGVLSVIEPNSFSKHADNLKLGTKASMLYVCSLMSCVPVSLNFEGGMGLGAAWGQEKARQFLSECGFEPSLDTADSDMMHFLCRKR